MMDKSNINKVAYDQVEELSEFKSIVEIKNYRRKRKHVYQNHIIFFKNFFKKKLNIVDIGSGSSALLYFLEEKNILLKGLGVEFSKSRFNFAEKWRIDENFRNVKNINKDFTKVKFEKNYYDIFLCIDNTFSLLEPQDISYPKTLLDNAHYSLKNNGLLLLEIRNFSKEIENMRRIKENYFWRKETGSPFKYSLYYSKFNDKNNHIETDSIYIGKNSKDKSKKEISFAYDENLIKELVYKKFKLVNIFDGFSLNVANENSSNLLFLLSKLK